MDEQRNTVEGRSDDARRNGTLRGGAPGVDLVAHRAP
jgi:hypothetical protein